MKIRRLELIGFKSFMNKTTLHFEDGITGIVGPNGCGKSNVVDALFWVMGDQSAKHLRGTEMGDVIFAGSDQEPPSGLSEINITFSTEDGGVPAEYSQFPEVTISRRLYRSGESEYLINKTPCRLKDVAEFFMDTGIGTKSYSIIEQGQIGRIVSQKPEERRSLIEEAAGITKFKSRKREASLKMDATDQNLLRINDIISEIKRQIDSLERQAKKAEKYKQIKEQIREIELTLMSREYDDFSQKLKEVETALQEHKNQHGEFLAEIQKIEALIEKLKLHLTSLEKDLQVSQESVYSLQHHIQELENQIEIKKKETENWKALELKDKKDEVVIVEKKEKLQKNILTLVDAADEFLKEDGQLKTKEEEKEVVLQGEIQKQGVLNQKIEEHQSELVSLLTRLAQCQNTIVNIEQQKKSLDAKEEHLEEEAEKLKTDIEHVSYQKETAEHQISEVQTKQKDLGEALKDSNERLVHQKEVLEQKRALKDNAKEELQKVSSRLHSLQELERRLEGFEVGAQKLLPQKTAYQILGILADVIEVDPQYEVATETVLQQKLQYIVIQDRQRLLEAIEYLKAQKSGQAHFIVLNQTSSIPVDRLQVTSLEPLWKKIKVKDPYQALLQHLLKDTYVVPDLKTAFEFWDRSPHLYTFVTVEGEMVNASGVIRGGMYNDAQPGILFKKREIKELEEKQKTLEVAYQNSQGEVEEGERTILAITEEIQKISQGLHEKEVSHVSFSKDISKTDEDFERLQEEKEVLTFEKEELTLSRQELLQTLSKEKNNASLLEETKKAKEASLETEKLTQGRVAQDIEKQKKDIHQIQVDRAALKEKESAIQRQKEHLEQNLKTLDQELEEKKTAICLSKERQEAIQGEITGARESLNQKISELETCRMTLVSLKTEFDTQQEKIRVLEEGVKKHRLTFSHIESEMHAKELLISQYQMSIKHLKSQVEEKYVLDLGAVADRYKLKTVTEEDKALLATLKEKIARMGEINLTAIEEFDSLNQRYQSLETQRQDLLQSLDSLKKTIEKINRITRERFNETFEVVNNNFKKVFPLLFQGGKAELILTDTHNLLETGVDIMAKPPGKKLQNINLLSGGEKALTAVSLIFAIFLMKRSPVCVLDEVDAPLDDANVGRFNEMVKTMTDKSQFIVITHNKKTMAMADVLYGVTMERPGISSIISVKLEKAVQMTQKTSKVPHQPEASA